MEELKIKHQEQTELQAQKRQQIEKQLVGEILPYSGHFIFEICYEDFSLKKAEYIKKPFEWSLKAAKREILIREGYVYISALNKKNALKKFRQGLNGSKEIIKHPLTLNIG